jgi:hypothetical protein
VPKLPFLAEICRVLTANGVFAVADTMPHSPEACCLGLVGLGEQAGLRVVSFRDITVNVCEAVGMTTGAAASWLTVSLATFGRSLGNGCLCPGLRGLGNSSERSGATSLR